MNEESTMKPTNQEGPMMSTRATQMIVAGALYDLIGWLTSRDERLTLSSTDPCAAAVLALIEFADLRGLPLDDAAVQSWAEAIASPVAAQAQPEQCNNGCRCVMQCGDVYDHEGKQQPVSGADGIACFCDRMYPDSNPDASCGDCPTRDYRQPQPSGNAGELDERATAELFRDRLINGLASIDDCYLSRESIEQAVEDVLHSFTRASALAAQAGGQDREDALRYRRLRDNTRRIEGDGEWAWL